MKIPIKPQALKPGDLIGIAASASPFEREAFEEGVLVLKNMGFEVYFRPDIFEKKSYLAGSDTRRAEELLELLNNPQIKAVLFARGGYGLMRLLPALDSKKISSEPKIVLGYSDITSLHLYLMQKKGWPIFYGPVVAKDLKLAMDAATRGSLYQALTQVGALPEMHFPETVALKPGVCEGVVTGGCLSLVVASLGTPYEIATDDRILFLEDINEKAYAVDRMLTQLTLAGKLQKVRGLIFGSFANGGDLSHYRETVEDVLRDFKGPVLFNFPAGHSPVKITLPLGVKARLDAGTRTLHYLESALS